METIVVEVKDTLEVCPSAHITTLPACPIVIGRTNHEYRVPLTLPNRSPIGTVIVFIGAFAALGIRWHFFPSNGFCINEFCGTPHFPFKYWASGMGATLIRRCIRTESEKQDCVSFSGFQDAATLSTIRPNLAPQLWWFQSWSAFDNTLTKKQK